MAKSAIDQKREERLEEWKIWLTEFVDTLSADEKTHLETLPNAAELLNDYYWRLAKQFIRPLLQEASDDEHNIHYYKIISASELTVMAVLPWTFKEGHSHTSEQRGSINARFGFMVAISIMLNWKIEGNEIVNVDELNKVTGYIEIINIDKDRKPIPYPNNFTQEHIAWLQYLNVHGPLPVLSNSQTWRMCYIACTAIRNKGKL